MQHKIFLTGAGFATPFGGPTTSCLTELMLADSTLITSTDQYFPDRIMEYLKQKESDRDPDEFNFEHFFHALHKMMVAGYDKSKGREARGIDILLAELISDSGIHQSMKLNWSLRTLINRPTAIWDFNKDVINNYYVAMWIQMYFEELLTKQIFKYDIGGKNEHNDIVQNFVNYIDTSFQKGKVLYRCYTLNYDYMLNKAWESKHPTDYTDGYTLDEPLYYSDSDSPTLLFDRDSILTNSEKPAFLNLHGSVYTAYSSGAYGKQLIYPYRMKTLAREQEPKMVQDSIFYSDGRSMPPFPLIAGREKKLYIEIEPYKTYFEALGRDIERANELNIIGYSFSDEHVNKHIRTFLCKNEPITLIIVDWQDSRVMLKRLINATKDCPALKAFRSKCEVVAAKNSPIELNVSFSVENISLDIHKSCARDFINQFPQLFPE
ncbi:MAG: SIR2 family protein [Cryomorphaceae bacterium]|nr:SIR2 family protein [Flavobacteriales bacterium]